MLTALVIDAEPDARRRVAGLLRLGGWQVREAASAEDALRQADGADPDLVVTDASVPGANGASLLRRMRHNGSRARFVVVAAEPTDDVRAESTAAGALACLPKPVDACFLLDFLRSRTTGPTAQADLSEVPLTDVQDWDDLHDDDLDAELMDRLQEMYVNALPARLSAIAGGARSGDTSAVASAAYTLAGTSGQLGHPDVAAVCQDIAADARRGVLAHARMVQLQALALAGA